MPALLLTPEDQLQRLDRIITEVRSWQELDQETLLFKPAPKKWSIFEIVGHMNSAYHLYEERLNQVLQTLPEKEAGYTRFAARWLNRRLIRMFRPQDGKRKYKMGTAKAFLPEVGAAAASPEQIEAVFERFFRCQEHLKRSITESRHKDVSQTKINSAIGPIVRFYLPEAFDFLISHEERHLQQGREVLAVRKRSQV